MSTQFSKIDIFDIFGHLLGLKLKFVQEGKRGSVSCIIAASFAL